MQHAGQHDVADVAAAALQEAGVFLAAKAVADELHAEVQGMSRASRLIMELDL